MLRENAKPASMPVEEIPVRPDRTVPLLVALCIVFFLAAGAVLDMLNARNSAAALVASGLIALGYAALTANKRAGR